MNICQNYAQQRYKLSLKILYGQGFPSGSVVKKFHLQCKRSSFQSLVWEDALDEGMAIHSSILTWRIPWTEELGKLQSMGYKESDTTEVTNRLTLSHSCLSFFVVFLLLPEFPLSQYNNNMHCDCVISFQASTSNSSFCTCTEIIEQQKYGQCD